MRNLKYDTTMPHKSARELKKIRSLPAVIAMAGLMLLPASVLADAAVGDSVVSIGANLDTNERSAILDELNAPKDAQIIEVTNDEEHKYLGDVVPAGKIGHKAISSSLITYTEAGSGLDIDVSDKINYITESTYRNALITAGVTDADVVITAPNSVTGTAALTGIMKAYEQTSGAVISDEVKKVANEEMVVSQQLTEEMGEQETNDLINSIKVAMEKNMPANEEQLRTVINNVAQEYHITISDNQVESLVGLFTKMKNANINWDQVAQEAGKYSDVAKDLASKAKDYLSSPEGQQVLEQSKGIFAQIIDWIKNFFAGL
ncbi:DUF1002 domain-containing protein [Peptoniphilus equinus]|uniref:DUF1002 domain-containing protein n=1 Tax=Peptoniphilus equinus TaxID=3016343 RepID=A0ABY7QU17_9FIRM|nr:DUF1002 domain-containing protein [Peptoniphilus equinus]WBW49946.1 DUF1002 domain-containing protein [Peptoniphilus equinus]